MATIKKFEIFNINCKNDIIQTYAFAKYRIQISF